MSALPGRPSRATVRPPARAPLRTPILRDIPHPGRSRTVSTNGYADELRSMGRWWLESWKDVVRLRSVPQDVLAGVTVAAVALPLNLALAVASGLPPSAGLAAGAIGGAFAALLGGAPLQVTGPAAALSTLVFALVADFGVAGAAAAAVVVGLLQIVLGLALAGKLVKFVPEAVLAGFTTGVGLKLLDNQIPELLGFNYTVSELAQMLHRPEWLREVSWIAALCGLAVAFLVTSTRPLKRFPAALVGVGVVTALASYLGWDIQRVGEVPSSLPWPALPVLAAGRWMDLAIASLPLALLASAETLLSARAVDRMTPGMRVHQPNVELLGQGVANTVVGLVGGMPISGVIVRSGVNVQSGGKSRISSLVHGGALLFAMLFLSESIAMIPLAGLAGLLIVVGVRLVEVKTLLHLWREERAGALAFVVTAAGTVTGHLMLGLVAGMVIHGAHALLNRKQVVSEEVARKHRSLGIRAVLGREDGAGRRPSMYEPPPIAARWLANIRERATMAASAFVHNQATIIGKVVLGEHVHIAAGSSVRADEGSPFFIGDNTNLQDGVVIHALKERKVVVGGEEWAVYVGQNVSIAHDALVHGPCFVGDNTFIGFKSIVHDSIVGEHCFIGHGALVVGVEVPAGRFVPHGAVIDSADKVAQLAHVSESHAEFNEDVVDVNRGLAVAYREHERGLQLDPVDRIRPSPRSLPPSTARRRDDSRF